MTLNKQLEQLGMTEKEAKVYVALLEMGDATAQELATKSGLNRATTYVILESLEKKNLIKNTSRNKKTYFIIENPLQMLDLLYQEKKDLNDKIEIAKKIMPELEMLGRLTTERTKVKFFEGRDGIAMIQKDILKSKAKKIDNIFNINIALKYFPSSKNDHRQKYNKKNIQGRTIAVYDSKKEIPSLPLIKGEERRYLPLNKFPFFADFVLYKNKVALISVKNKWIGIVIESKDIVEGLRSLFELAWQGAEKYIAIKENK